MNKRTCVEKVAIDSRAGSRPRLLSADFCPLAVQPGSEVGGVRRGVRGKDVIDIPVAGKGRKDHVVTGGLSPTAIRVGPGIGTLENLDSS